MKRFDDPKQQADFEAGREAVAAINDRQRKAAEGPDHRKSLDVRIAEWAAEGRKADAAVNQRRGAPSATNDGGGKTTSYRSDGAPFTNGQIAVSMMGGRPVATRSMADRLHAESSVRSAAIGYVL